MEDKSDKQTLPAGFRINAAGHHVPVELIDEVDLLRDTLVLELATRAAELSRQLAALKAAAFGDIAAFIELSAEKYQVKRRGSKGNVTLHSFDGMYKIQFACQERISFDERLQAAKALVDECILIWSADSKPEIRALINGAFDTDREGKLNTGRILSLRRLKIDDERWTRAMAAIGESVQVTGSKQYVRFYRRRPDNQEYEHISLDLAAI